MSARARRTPLQETPSRRTWGCLAVRVSTLRSGRSSRRAWEYHSPFGKFTSSESALHAVSRPLEAPSTRCPALVDAQPPPSPMCSLALVDALPHPRLVLVHFTRAKSAVVVLSLNASPF